MTHVLRLLSNELRLMTFQVLEQCSGLACGDRQKLLLFFFNAVLHLMARHLSPIPSSLLANTTRRRHSMCLSKLVDIFHFLIYE